MRTTPNERARSDYNAGRRQSTDEFIQKISSSTDTVAPFEILGGSIVPGITTVPAILQGTFVQVTNIGQVNDAFFQVAFTATQPFNFESDTSGVTLDVNIIDPALEVFDLTDHFKGSGSRTISFGEFVPQYGTIIAGIQYLVKPKTSALSDKPVFEEMGNRGFIQFGATNGALFEVTVTVRQVFIKSLADPMDIISASAYSVPLSTGPLYEGTYTEAEIFGGS